MARKNKKSFEELYEQNMKALLKDQEELGKIEEKIEKRHMGRLEE